MTTPTTVPVRFKLRQDTAANWTSVNPVLLAGEQGRESDTGKIKIGTGSAAWTSLAYQLVSDANVAANAGILGTKIFASFGNQLVSTTNVLRVGSGNQGAPGFSFGADINTGIYRVGEDQVGVSTNGIERIRCATTAVISTLPIHYPLGAAATPSVTFTGDLNTGIFSPGADQVAISTNGVARLTTSTTAVSSSLAIDHPLGAVGTPSITFTGDLNTGFFSPTADTVAASTAGTEQMRITSTGDLRFNSGFGSAGTAYGCRAWVSFSATGGVITVNGSGNVSSVIRNAAGDHTVNFSTAMPNANFAANATSGSGFTGHVQNLLTSQLNILTKEIVTGTAGDAGQNHVSAFR